MNAQDTLLFELMIRELFPFKWMFHVCLQSKCNATRGLEAENRSRNCRLLLHAFRLLRLTVRREERRTERVRRGMSDVLVLTGSGRHVYFLFPQQKVKHLPDSVCLCVTGEPIPC
jgi:hypothetical protein